MPASLSYAIKFVANMEEPVRFHAGKIGLRLRFQSPQCSEFDIGSTALHIGSSEH